MKSALQRGETLPHCRLLATGAHCSCYVIRFCYGALKTWGAFSTCSKSLINGGAGWLLVWGELAYFIQTKIIVQMLHVCRPGQLMKFTTRQVTPQSVSTTTLVVTDFLFSILIFYLQQAQYSKVQAERIESMCH